MLKRKKAPAKTHPADYSLLSDSLSSNLGNRSVSFRGFQEEWRSKSARFTNEPEAQDKSMRINRISTKPEESEDSMRVDRIITKPEDSEFEEEKLSQLR